MMAAGVTPHLLITTFHGSHYHYKLTRVPVRWLTQHRMIVFVWSEGSLKFWLLRSIFSEHFTEI